MHVTNVAAFTSNNHKMDFTRSSFWHSQDYLPVQPGHSRVGRGSGGGWRGDPGFGWSVLVSYTGGMRGCFDTN
jgi:hypothetical protein